MNFVIDLDGFSFLSSLEKVSMTDFSSGELFDCCHCFLAPCGCGRSWSKHNPRDRFKDLFNQAVVQSVHVNVLTRRTKCNCKDSFGRAGGFHNSCSMFSSLNACRFLSLPILMIRRGIVGVDAGGSVISRAILAYQLVPAGRVSTCEVRECCEQGFLNSSKEKL